jgi:hypothetical protein
MHRQPQFGKAVGGDDILIWKETTAKQYTKEITGGEPTFGPTLLS